MDIRTTEPRQRTTAEEVNLILAKFLSDVDKGVCPHCTKTLEWERQVRRSVYGSCGCRLWQGKARTIEELKGLVKNEADRSKQGSS